MIYTGFERQPTINANSIQNALEGFIFASGVSISLTKSTYPQSRQALTNISYDKEDATKMLFGSKPIAATNI